MGWEELPTMKSTRSALSQRAWSASQRAAPSIQRTIAPARAALDEICRTGDYDFGIRPFKVLERSFTDLREDLGYMRLRIEYLKKAGRR